MTEFMNALYQGDLSRQMRERNERRRAIGPDVMPAMGGDREALGRIAQADPDVALKIASTIQGMDARRQAQARSSLEIGGRLAAGVLMAPPDQQPALYAQALEQARAMGVDTSKYPPQWGPAAKAWLQHNATMMGSVTSILKRLGAGSGAGGGGAPSGVPARPAGFGGPPVPPPAAAPARTSDAAPAIAPPASVASLPQPPPAAAGPLPGDIPPPPQIAGAPPADGAPAMAAVEIRVSPQRLAMLGADFVAPKDQRTADEFALAPGEMYGAKKNGEPIVENGMVLVRTRDRGDVLRRLPAARIKPMGGGAPDPAIEALRGFQPPPGWGVATRNGKVQTDGGTVQLVRPGPNFANDPDDYEIAFVPLPQRADPAAKAAPARWEDVRDEKTGRLLGQRRVDTNEYKPIDRNAGSAGRPLGDTDIKSLGAAGTSAQEFVGLRDTFDDSFGGFKYDAVGTLDNFAKRNLPDSWGGADPKGQADWWSRYQSQKNIIRNALFGSALTATEKAEFDKAMIDPGMKPEVIRRNLARQADAALRAAAKIARAKEASGYNREAIEAALGIPLDTLPSPTAKPIADKPKGGAPKPAAAPKPGNQGGQEFDYNPQTGRFD